MGEPQQLLLAPPEPAAELELVNGAIADVVVSAKPAPSGLEQRNLYGEARRIVARAASAGARRRGHCVSSTPRHSVL